MTATPSSVNPPSANPELLALLRNDMTACGFTVDGVEEYLGPVASAALRREESLPAERRTRRQGGSLGALIRLFALGVEVEFDDVDEALPELGGDGLVELGLARRVGAALVACVDLRPYADENHAWWVASDLSPTGAALEPHHVVGIGGASATLAAWTPRPHVKRALDLGTGGGVQALHLSAHADEVVATDLSQRALEFASFNAALAGATWDLRQGSLFEPVAGEEFDLVVSNPPYVITPRADGIPVLSYRDGGVPGDGVMRALVDGAGGHLRPGGLAHFIGNWEIRRGEEWSQRLRSWLEPLGVDAWVIQRDVQDPAQYASTWARDGGQLPGSWMYDELYSAWLDDFAARDVGGIGFGMVTLQRPTSGRATFMDFLDVRGQVSLPMGHAIEAGMAARTWLAEHTEEDLLAAHLVAADDVTIERHSLPGQSGPSALVIRQGSGLQRGLKVSPAVSAVVDVADGELSLGQSLVAIAALLEEDSEQVRLESLPVIKDLIAGGFLRIA